MGRQIHEKKNTDNPKRFRVWDTSSDVYWNKPTTLEEVKSILLEEAAERAVSEILMRFHKGFEQENIEKVDGWCRAARGAPEQPGSREAFQKAYYGALVSSSLERAEDGTTTITVTIRPLKK